MHAAGILYFREIARSGSVRKAAQRLRVAASAVDRQLHKLEAELGAALFDRLPGGMRLTIAGELLLRHVDATLHDFERVRAEIDDLKAAKSGHVAIAAVDSLLVDFLPRVIDRFRGDFPAVTYEVRAVQPADVPTEIAEGRAEIGFTFVSRVPTAVRFTAEAAAPIGVVMPADHPLAKRKAIGFEEAARYPMLAQSGPLPREADIDPAFAEFRRGIEPKLVSNSIQMLKLAIRQRMGIAFFTRLGFLGEIESGEIVWRPFKSRAINRLKIGLLVPASRKLSGPAGVLARELASELRMLGPGAAG